MPSGFYGGCVFFHKALNSSLNTRDWSFSVPSQWLCYDFCENNSYVDITVLWTPKKQPLNFLVGLELIIHRSWISKNINNKTSNQNSSIWSPYTDKLLKIQTTSHFPQITSYFKTQKNYFSQDNHKFKFILRSRSSKMKIRK